MKRTTILILGFTVALCGTFGCSKQSKESKADSAILQGTWKGTDGGANPQAVASLILSGQTLEFRGADPNEWYKGTFTLRADANPKQMIVAITECPFPKYVGQTSLAIYRIEGDTMTIAANEPGHPTAPAGFDAPDTRQITLKKE